MFGVSDHDLLYSIDDKEIDPEVSREIMEAIQHAQTQAEGKLKEVPSTPKRGPAEKPPKSAKKVIASKENDNPKNGKLFLLGLMACVYSSFPLLADAIYTKNAQFMNDALQKHQPPTTPCTACASHRLQYLTSVSALTEAAKEGRLLLGLHHCLSMVDLCAHQKSVQSIAVLLGKELGMTTFKS